MCLSGPSWVCAAHSTHSGPFLRPTASIKGPQCWHSAQSGCWRQRRPPETRRRLEGARGRGRDDGDVGVLKWGAGGAGRGWICHILEPLDCLAAAFQRRRCLASQPAFHAVSCIQYVCPCWQVPNRGPYVDRSCWHQSGITCFIHTVQVEQMKPVQSQTLIQRWLYGLTILCFSSLSLSPTEMRLWKGRARHRCLHFSYASQRRNVKNIFVIVWLLAASAPSSYVGKSTLAWRLKTLVMRWWYLRWRFGKTGYKALCEH